MSNSKSNNRNNSRIINLSKARNKLVKTFNNFY